MPLLVVVIGLLAGCGKNRGASVNGTVTYKGRPVVEGSLSFIPHGKPAAYARLRPDGSYALLNHQGRKDVEPGSYVVVIVSGINRSLSLDAPKTGNQELPVPVSVTNQATTPLKFDVAPGPNTIDINLDKLPAKAPSSAKQGDS